MPFIFINRNQYGTGMPDFWPIQLETGALPNVPFPPITLVFICLPTSRKLLSVFAHNITYLHIFSIALHFCCN